MNWYLRVNGLAKDMNCNRLQRHSVPFCVIKEDENYVEETTFLSSIVASSEAWRAIKMVILGHGQIGKTTLLSSIKKLLKQDDAQVCTKY